MNAKCEVNIIYSRLFYLFFLILVTIARNVETRFEFNAPFTSKKKKCILHTNKNYRNVGTMMLYLRMPFTGHIFI